MYLADLIELYLCKSPSNRPYSLISIPNCTIDSSSRSDMTLHVHGRIYLKGIENYSPKKIVQQGFFLAEKISEAEGKGEAPRFYR